MPFKMMTQKKNLMFELHKQERDQFYWIFSMELSSCENKKANKFSNRINSLVEGGKVCFDFQLLKFFLSSQNKFCTMK